MRERFPGPKDVFYGWILGSISRSIVNLKGALKDLQSALLLRFIPDMVFSLASLSRYSFDPGGYIFIDIFLKFGNSKILDKHYKG